MSFDAPKAKQTHTRDLGQTNSVEEGALAKVLKGNGGLAKHSVDESAPAEGVKEDGGFAKHSVDEGALAKVLKGNGGLAKHSVDERAPAKGVKEDGGFAKHSVLLVRGPSCYGGTPKLSRPSHSVYDPAKSYLKFNIIFLENTMNRSDTNGSHDFLKTC